VNTAFLHLGSNEGNRLEMIDKATAMIEGQIGKLLIKSSLYETEAWGMKDQPDFINQAVKIDTPHTSLETLQLCKKIEHELGSMKKEKWGQRSIDIDLLFWNESIISDENISLPHPQIENRNFVLIPLMEIAGEFIHPVLNKSIEEIFDECEDDCEVLLYER
jgi:2-amino-4-hydroxy-6-hydroxymethyldihydropteridine diphosphokinase